MLIVGAGLSGIGSAYHLQEKCPGKTYTILENRDAMGGTWDLFRYPGIRSDSDMHTLGYAFKPWKAEKSIADGPAIKQYVEETAQEAGIEKHIRFRHRVKSANWSSRDARWTVEAIRQAPGSAEDSPGEPVRFSCNFLFMCAGYYRYDKGYTPEFEGLGDFEGRLVHPQHWPEDLDYRGKRVAVIGSGATAVTLIPSMAEEAEHVTMIQRSPTYVVSRPAKDRIANALRKFLPESLAYRITRFKNIQFQKYAYQRTRTHPDQVKERLLDMTREALGPEADFEKHWVPRYNPWDQRLCLVPDGDLFEAMREGKASVVTGQIDRITKSGVRMQSGEEIECDVLVTATGLNLIVLGGTEFSLDGEPIDFAKTFTYKGMLYSDIPNLAQTFGYVNASWTLRADLTAEYVCRLLNRMDETGKKVVVPRLRAEDKGMDELPWIDDFNPGYMQRVMHLMPKQGGHAPWRNTQNYALDKKMIRNAPLEDGALTFE